MIATIKEDAPVLLPNKEYKNFTQSRNEVIKKDSIVEGEPRIIAGLKKGKPFQFKIFYTKDGKIIDFNKIQAMEKTEVVLNAEGEEKSGLDALVNLKPGEMFNKTKLIGLCVGAAAGFLYCKHKGHSTKKCILYAIGGGVVGYGVAFFATYNHKGTVKKG